MFYENKKVIKCIIYLLWTFIIKITIVEDHKEKHKKLYPNGPNPFIIYLFPNVVLFYRDSTNVLYAQEGGLVFLRFFLVYPSHQCHNYNYMLECHNSRPQAPVRYPSCHFLPVLHYWAYCHLVKIRTIEFKTFNLKISQK